MGDNGAPVAVGAPHQEAGGEPAVVEVVHPFNQQAQGRQAVQEDAHGAVVGLEPGRDFHGAAGLFQEVEDRQFHRHAEHLGRLETPAQGHELIESAFRVQSHSYPLSMVHQDVRRVDLI